MESLNRLNNCINALFAIQISLIKMHLNNHISISNLLSVMTEVCKVDFRRQCVSHTFQMQNFSIYDRPHSHRT